MSSVYNQFDLRLNVANTSRVRTEPTLTTISNHLDIWRIWMNLMSEKRCSTTGTPTLHKLHRFSGPDLNRCRVSGKNWVSRMLVLISSSFRNSTCVHCYSAVGCHSELYTVNKLWIYCNTMNLECNSIMQLR